MAPGLSRCTEEKALADRLLAESEVSAGMQTAAELVERHRETRCQLQASTLRLSATMAPEIARIAEHC
jgi:hypothetical protein